MSRKLPTTTGPKAHTVKSPEEQRLVNQLLENVLRKAESFLDGEYVAPTPEELTAVRKTLGITRDVAAKKTKVSLRTWTSREGGEGASTMRAQEFAMVTLFLLRATPEWGRLANKLQQPIQN